jgi:hypothetical protein
MVCASTFVNRSLHTLQGSFNFLILLPYCLASLATTSERFGFPTSKGWGGPLTFFD